jgi:competence protein ComEC
VLWPEAGDAAGCGSGGSPERNRCSIVARISYGDSRALLTGDIDTVALRALSAGLGFGLRCDMLIAPHHGSAGGVDRVFYGFAAPSTVVVSCGRDNPYGHPAQALLDLAFETAAEVHITWRDGTCRVETQGYYWTRR